eukprot:3933238-Rhodomonas_salina.9
MPATKCPVLTSRMVLPPATLGDVRRWRHKRCDHRLVRMVLGCLRQSYAMSGTDLAYDSVCLREFSLASGAISPGLRACYATSGTDLAHVGVGTWCFRSNVTTATRR